MQDPLRLVIRFLRAIPHSWRMVTTDFAAEEAKYTVIVRITAELVRLRVTLDTLAEIEQMGSDALLEIPSASDLFPAIIRARMVAVHDIAINESPLGARCQAA